MLSAAALDLDYRSTDHKFLAFCYTDATVPPTNTAPDENVTQLIGGILHHRCSIRDRYCNPINSKLDWVMTVYEELTFNCQHLYVPIPWPWPGYVTVRLYCSHKSCMARLELFATRSCMLTVGFQAVSLVNFDV